jgi:uncharacterized protein (TIGR03435 family)
MRRVWTQTALLAAFIIGTSVVLPGQQQADQPISFEEVSIKPHNSSNGPVSLQPTPGGLRATNKGLKYLISEAYGIPWFRIVGDESRLAERFDVVAQMPQGARRAPLPQMLQALLEERFKLKAHFENREQPIYALVLSKSDGTLGPDLHHSNIDCASRSVQRVDHDGLPCGSSRSGWRLTINGMPLTTLAKVLTVYLDRVVEDRTGLVGTYDLTLTDVNNPIDGSLFTNVERELGLKLESTTGPVDVLVIDHVERPTPD